MEKFIIQKIKADFDERWLRVKKIDDGKIQSMMPFKVPAK